MLKKCIPQCSEMLCKLVSFQLLYNPRSYLSIFCLATLFLGEKKFKSRIRGTTWLSLTFSRWHRLPHIYLNQKHLARFLRHHAFWPRNTEVLDSRKWNRRGFCSRPRRLSKSCALRQFKKGRALHVLFFFSDRKIKTSTEIWKPLVTSRRRFRPECLNLWWTREGARRSQPWLQTLRCGSGL